MKSNIKVINEKGEIRIFNELPKKEQNEIRHRITNKLIEAFAKDIYKENQKELVL
jgi:hypothetical protein